MAAGTPEAADKEEAMYGEELVLDIHGCNVELFTRKAIKAYLVKLCDEIIGMERAQLHWWDYEGEPEEYAEAPAHLKGVSCVQFITTSTIVIHTLEELGTMMVNIFSCKDFDPEAAAAFTGEYFDGEIITEEVINRL